ncbi:Malonyl CoA-acyl carrier protein transacylase (plasmid) [Tsukamurella tyrosinosolvens]|uniref:Fatty acid synthase n=1 Tax=Tsukamurella tyrosinosolvens TaxID=57704 RepID=A0A1H4QE16_TSUTY|nr:type I polyketide synthase [Tsukamurella tyrosinosolvens]KXO91586.1 3-oxoacyl-ACP synthase [Tsukamurella tyrosinosolvens]SEC17808.1 fatty acid synthase [Tsukamurella tyrosinosolvens]VEH92784.1 Malonyl CoA-acyl carrier protein transacylase [Tsukamurella tyrosinosolvens]
MTVDDFVTANARTAKGPRSNDALVDRLAAGEQYALTFGGQGGPWLPGLVSLLEQTGLADDPEYRDLFDGFVARADSVLEPVRAELLRAQALTFDPMRWRDASIAASEAETTDDEDEDAAQAATGSSRRLLAPQVDGAVFSVPGVLFSQLVALYGLEAQGLDPWDVPPVAAIGHSQGQLAVSAFASRGNEGDLLAIARLIGAAGRVVARRKGLVALGGATPMMAVTGVRQDKLEKLLADFTATVAFDACGPVLAVRNNRNSFVLTGTPKLLAGFREFCESVAETEEEQRKEKLTGGAAFAPKFEDVAVDIGFHHPALADGVGLVTEWAERCGLDTDTAARLAAAVLVEPVDWVAEVEGAIGKGARWLIDLGPEDIATKLSAAPARGRGVGLVPATTLRGARNLFSPGGVPELPLAWSEFAPRLVTLPDGRTVLSTRFTELTGRSPILLAGMTPTTVDPGIVAAAANAGHWAELAGGGQVTEPIFADNVAKLTALLEPGRAAQFNSLFLDPYLWKLQLGGKRIVQKARAAGAPLDGVIITAGIPELEEATALVEELTEAGMRHVAFKPGTVEQIRQVARIAAEVPQYPVIVHVEGGKAGGHHSWEDLDELLLVTYAELRDRNNVVLAVGGGIGTPELAAEYLSGEWSRKYGAPAMPVDGILVGTAAMATLEATTSDDVKRLLADIPGTPDWIGAGHAGGGMASGRSQLGADIHEIDNTASACGRLLDEVAGDGDAVAERRDEIVAAMAGTAKPYFGDADAMTYAQWLERYLELSVGTREQVAAANASRFGDYGWLDITHQDRFLSMLHRAEARLATEDRGPIATAFADVTATDDAYAALEQLLQRYPEAADTRLHPADVPFFVSLCRTPGKPVNFVPVVDKDVRRWWRSDSLWQAHSPRYSADEVCIIPGPEAVAGITRVDEPVGDLLNRFEAELVRRRLGEGVVAEAVAGRRVVPGVESVPLARALAATNVLWAGRLVHSPIARLGSGSTWTVEADGDSALQPATGARLRVTGANAVVLEIPVSGTDLVIPIEVPDSCADGGVPVIELGAASEAMSKLVALAAAGDLPTVSDGAATIDFEFRAEDAADHAAITADSLPVGLSALYGDEQLAVPDAFVGLCWPASFAVVGAATTAEGRPVVEGMLDLVHLDHAIELAANPTPGAYRATARLEDVTATDIGTVVTVGIDVRAPGADAPAVVMTERFAIRGRTGEAELADPQPAGGARGETATETPRKRVRQAVVNAPQDMSGFAAVSGDHNPIHTSQVAASLAGLPGPIVHGMWLSAAAQQVASASNGDVMHRKIRGWTTRFLGMVLPGDEVQFTVERVGIDRGGELLEVTARVGDDLVMAASAVAFPAVTAYVFPGQGIQGKGMGLNQRSRSKAAREVWDAADEHTRENLGFSILAVVRDNPLSIRANGTLYTHPDGVLYLTEFTQVAMATVACAQLAELTEIGARVDDPIIAGHSVGEYNALASAGVLPLGTILETVFHRGRIMQQLVPRDEQGRSPYAMAALRPELFDVDDADIADWVEGNLEGADEFAEIVNLNLRGAQYVVVGNQAGLDALEKAIAERTGSPKAFQLVPGIDIPFHSSVLRDGVPEFAARLQELVPAEFDYTKLVGKYLPNLVARPFELTADFAVSILDVVPSEPVRALVADWDAAAANPMATARTLLIELLAWQFASPVRWIETQDQLLIDTDHGGLGVERFIEVGLASAPTLANLASRTLALASYQRAAATVLNAERDAAKVFATDEDVPEDDAAEATDEAAAPAAAAPAAAAPAAAPVASAPSGGPRPADLGFDAADATRAMIAIWTKMRPDQLEKTDTIETLCDGVSSRRNQLLLDLGSELNLGAIDGAAEADLPTLAGTVTKLARTYKPLGPVLSETVGNQLRKLLGSTGKRPNYITEYVTGTWELGPGWAQHAVLALATGTREGASVRGGDLATLLDGPVSNAAALDALIDRAVAEVGAAQGVPVGKPSAGGGGGGATVDAAALAEFTSAITGEDGALASSARVLLQKLGLESAESGLPELDDESERLAALIATELGDDWANAVAPAFDANKAVLIDDRWASAREDLLRVWNMDPSTFPTYSKHILETAKGAGKALQDQAQWWEKKATEAGRTEHARAYAFLSGLAKSSPEPGVYAGEVAVVTGASAGSIAAAVAARLLAGGATVIATTSRLDDKRLDFFKELYRTSARTDAALWVVPANMASYADVDGLVEWIGERQAETVGPYTTVHKEALVPTMLFPFAAPRVSGDMSDAGPRAELEMKILLWSVERLIAGLAAIGKDTDLASRLHVVLPGSPNRGMFGGDGAYGESKASLDALVTRWNAEKSWSERVTLAHAIIGWVRGTGLMGGNDPLVEAVEAAGVRTWSTFEMADKLLANASAEARERAATAPLFDDLTGGLGGVNLDMKALAEQAMEARLAEAAEAEDEGTIDALPGAPVASLREPDWGSVEARPEDMVVIVGAGEVGPYGSSRTRFEMEVDERLSAAGVAELAWVTGMITWENDPEPGWYDAESGDLVPEAELADKYHDAVVERCGIREFSDDGDIVDQSAPLLVSVFLPEDMSFVVANEAEARAFVEADPENTVAVPMESGEWRITRKAGTEIRVPRRTKLLRSVGGQIPDGFDPTHWGITPEMIESVDRLALWNLVATVDAFISAGFEPAELMEYVHPSHVANTQGTGMGGMSSMRDLFINTLLGEPNQNDILQEALPNVVAAHVVQSYVGSYGAMIHPVAACATAAVSVEEGVDKIKVGKALFAVTGGFDDLSIEGITGFGMMQATADSEKMLAKGISPRRFSRANDRRRGGFVESNGGGTVLLARGDVAAKMGLPVLGVVAWAQSFGDGVHTSIPAPGMGALSVAAGGPEAPMARSLRQLGVAADDVSIISKHDTSTNANDPNEANLHERIAASIGRSEGAPMFVVSQKSLTGHAKGGAAAFQLIGMCQMLNAQVVPPNRSLDCVDDEMRKYPHLVWLRETHRFDQSFRPKAGLLTSLGFGHVSGLIAVVHRDAFLASLEPAARAEYLATAREREVAGARAVLSAMCGRSGLYRKPPAGRRFGADATSEATDRTEAALLLDEAQRLGPDGTYCADGCR